MPRARNAQVLSLLVLLLGPGCSDRDQGVSPDAAESGDVVTPAQARPPLGFTVWHADFPGQPELSPRVAGRWYDATRRQALENVVEHLQGNCSKNAWRFAKEFFLHVEGEDLQSLVEAMDEAFLVPNQVDKLGNITDAMGQAADPAMAPALLRALEHPNAQVRDKAIRALVTSGDADSVRRAFAYFQIGSFAWQGQWVRAAAEFLGEGVIDPFRRILAQPALGPLHDDVIEETRKLPPAIALEVMRPLWGSPPKGLRSYIAALRHMAGEAPGTVAVREYLDTGSEDDRVTVLQTLTADRIGDLLDDVQRQSAHESAGVRMLALSLIADVPGEESARILEAGTVDPDPRVVEMALRAQVQRNEIHQLEELVRTVRRGTGGQVRTAVQRLISVNYGPGVAAIAERMSAVPPEEKKTYLRGIGLIAHPAAVSALADVFLADEEIFPGSRELSVLYMGNARGGEREVLEIWRALEPSDYVRRALALRTLANIAADREDSPVRTEILAELRRVLMSREEIPQMRLLALQLVRKDLRLDDALALRRALKQEDAPMRKALSDFLFEYF